MLILSSRMRPTEQFEGYAFVGTDYVHGPAGMTAHRARTGRTVGPGEDGCYVVARRAGRLFGRRFEVGTDASGLGRLFLYRSGDEWALGSSYSGLVEHLRTEGMTLTPRLGRLRPFALRQTLTMQLSTFQTPFDEIRLLPVGTVAVIRGGVLSLERAPGLEPLEYEAALQEYLDVWRGRTRALLADPRVTFTADLSGGVDSRTVFAFLLESGLFRTDSERFWLHSGVNQKEDLAVARRIAEAHGLTVNGPKPPSRTLVSGSRAYRHWRENSLGVYTPVYMSSTFQNPFEVHAHGGGGGTIKQYYRHAEPLRLLEPFKGKMPAADFALWQEEMSTTQEQLKQIAPGVVPSIQHYLEFRNRFHFGHIPKARPLFMPLNSKYAIRALTSLPQDVRRRFYFDVMESLAPGLKDVDYDSARKAPTAQELESLLVLPASDRLAAGTAYGDDTVETADSDDPLSAGFQRWLQDIDRAAARPEVRRFIMGRAMARTDRTVEALRALGKPFHSHSGHSVALSHLLMVDFTLGD